MSVWIIYFLVQHVNIVNWGNLHCYHKVEKVGIVTRLEYF